MLHAGLKHVEQFSDPKDSIKIIYMDSADSSAVPGINAQLLRDTTEKRFLDE